MTPKRKLFLVILVAFWEFSNPLFSIPPANFTSFEVFFSRNAKLSAKVIEALRSSTQRTCIANYNLTNPKIIEELITLKKRNIDVQIIIAPETLQNQKKGIVSLLQANVPVYVFRRSYLMHHKFSIIDGQRTLFGSNNYSNQADSNREAMVIFDSIEISEKFLEEFEALKQESQQLETFDP